ncbi:MAG: hypothetical protein K8I27_04030 [Planctomycetes bacterium]|nr:hypothetical protein [Planctomycetota bacterium]
MKATVAIFAALTMMTVVFAGCNGDNASPAANSLEHRHEAAPGETLKLNDGSKWQADTNTREAVNRMQQTVREHTGDSMALGKVLQKQTSELVRKCTMTGEPHNQLHIWLNRYMPAVDHLAAETDDARSGMAREQVTHLLHEYDQFFE